MSDLIRPGVKGARWDLPRDGVEYVVCHVKSGPDWWDLDDEVGAIPGCKPVYAPHRALWRAIPMARIKDLESIAQRYPGRLVVHRSVQR